MNPLICSHRTRYQRKAQEAEVNEIDKSTVALAEMTGGEWVGECLPSGLGRLMKPPSNIVGKLWKWSRGPVNHHVLTLQMNPEGNECEVGKEQGPAHDPVAMNS